MPKLCICSFIEINKCVHIHIKKLCVQWGSFLIIEYHVNSNGIIKREKNHILTKDSKKKTSHLCLDSIETVIKIHLKLYL